MKKFNLGSHSTTWHLEMLLKFGWINEMKIESNLIYYETSLDIQNVTKAYYLSNEKVQLILDYLNNNNTEGCSKSEFSKNLNMHLNTVKKYLEKLVNFNAIHIKESSNKKLYFIK